jgi:Na+/phosphate symporter
MIGISAMGTYFQLRIFSATFFKNSKSVSLAALCVFYGVMFVNMNIVSSVEQTSKKIHQSQISIKSFNNWLQPN